VGTVHEYYKSTVALLFWLRGWLVNGMVGSLKHVDSGYWTVDIWKLTNEGVKEASLANQLFCGNRTFMHAPNKIICL
jgi:hypothetical protein